MYKNMLKKLIAVSLMVTCLSSVNVSAQAVDAYGYTEAEINAMSHKEFADYIADVVSMDVSFDEIQENLEKVGVTITQNQDDVNTRASISTDATLSVYCTHRGASAYYYLTASVTANKSLKTDCGTEDLISVEWDSDRASYYSYSATTNTTYMDGSQRNNGILLFNVQDVNMNSGSNAICSAIVKPNGSGALDYASKYVHTYTQDNYSWSIGSNISYQTTGAVCGSTYQISGTAASYSWQIYADDSVTI